MKIREHIHEPSCDHLYQPWHHSVTPIAGTCLKSLSNEQMIDTSASGENKQMKKEIIKLE